MKFAFALVAVLLASAPAAAQPIKLGDLTLENPWARATPKGAQVGAGYLTIRNDGGTADRLTGVAADFATVQVHEMKMNGGVMQMREVEGGLAIPAHQTVTLAPNGYHLMFLALKHPLAKGETAKATLTFERAGSVALDFPVAGIGAASPGAPAHNTNGIEMKGMKM